jgi:hypothetical protein
LYPLSTKAVFLWLDTVISIPKQIGTEESIKIQNDTETYININKQTEA